MSIADSFLSVLRCPLSAEPLTLLSEVETQRLDQRIDRGEICNLAGWVVKDFLGQPLGNASKTVIYPVRKGIPILQQHLAISITEDKPALERPLAQNPSKMLSEIDFWHGICDDPNYEPANRYQGILQDVFQLEDEFFVGKKMLDIGCGPKGSLDYFSMADLRIGLDPVAEGYLQFEVSRGITEHVCAVAECMPFIDQAFQIVISLNSLDHVDNLDPVISEIDRVLSIGGYFILYTEIHDEPTITEPMVMTWDINKRFKNFREVFRKEIEKDSFTRFFNYTNKAKRYGNLFSILQKVS